jgi:hypothetical protein
MHPERIAALEELLCEGLVDHTHPNAGRAIAFGDFAAAQQRDSERGEVIRSDVVIQRAPVVIARRRISFNDDFTF